MTSNLKMVSFVEEFIFDPALADYVGGRIEVWGDGPYAEREIRFFTKRTDEFYEFRDKWDLKDLTEKQLKRFEREVRAKYLKETLHHE